MMVEGKFISYQDEDLDKVFDIRRQVFQIEQGVDAELEFDDLDKEAVHVLVTVGGKAVACGRLLKESDTDCFRIGRVAVLKEERGRQYGDFVVRMLVDRAFQAGAKEIVLGSQLYAVDFYRKIGFVPFGEEYLDAGIKHIPMIMKTGGMCRDCQK